MKTALHFTLFFLIVILLHSCSKEEDRIENDMRAKLVGDWNVRHIVKEIRFDTVYSESATNSWIILREDGTGERQSFFINQTETIEWIYQQNPPKIAIFDDGEGAIFSSPTIAEIKEIQDDYHLWTYTVESNLVADEFQNILELTPR